MLFQLEQRDVAASQTLRAALYKAEASHPGFSYDLVLGMVRKSGDTPVNMNESLLRLQGAASDQDSHEYRSSRTEEPFQELNKKSAALKRILARIPDEITDRKTFLETIKEIASAIKKLLDSVNNVIKLTIDDEDDEKRFDLEEKKKDFIRGSKRFSNTLKDYFRNGNQSSVIFASESLISQVNEIMISLISVL